MRRYPLIDGISNLTLDAFYQISCVRYIIIYISYLIIDVWYLTLSWLTLWNTSPGGGQICRPLNYSYRRMFSLFFLCQGSFHGCKRSESKSTAIYLRKYSPESFWKNRHFWQNLKKNKKFAIWKPDFLSKKMPSKIN